VLTPEFMAYMTGIGTVPAPTPNPTVDAAWQVYRLGSIGPGVEKIQTTVGVDPDGYYGPSTVAAVAQWQARLGLRADGVWGPATQQATDGLFDYLNSLAVTVYLQALNQAAYDSYLHTLAAQQAATDAYLHGLAAQQGGPDAYLHQLAGEQAQLDAYLHTLASAR
jgi:peptidoglycan hydrolase-like protein with peptidoglycan-binding domain